jgi:AcrR family transcriptional regulator
MKKNITKEQIIETALDLMKNKSDLRRINMREIARTLGCAHTNLYNYFPSYNDLLWEAHAALQEVFIQLIKDKLEAANTAELRLSYFFEALVDIYISNEGWFRLSWHECISSERPLQNIEAIEKANKAINWYVSEIWNDLYGTYPDTEKSQRVLHNTHCYIVGEVSNYFLGRGLIESEIELKAYIVNEAIRMFRLCLVGE